MKTKIIVLSAILFIAFTSCKNESDSSKNSTVSSATEIKANFTVEVSAITDKDDNMTVYYTEDGTTNFDDSKALWGEIKAGKPDQKLVFQFPNEIIPKTLRLDFGIKRKENQGNVTLKNIRLTCYNNNFNIKGSDFLTYFVKNDSIDTQIDANAGTITFKQNLKNNAPAFFYPGAALDNEIAKLIK